MEVYKLCVYMRWSMKINQFATKSSRVRNKKPHSSRKTLVRSSEVEEVSVYPNQTTKRRLEALAAYVIKL